MNKYFFTLALILIQETFVAPSRACADTGSSANFKDYSAPTNFSESEQDQQVKGNKCGCAGDEVKCSPQIFFCGPSENTPQLKGYEIECDYNPRSNVKCEIKSVIKSALHFPKYCSTDSNSCESLMFNAACSSRLTDIGQNLYSYSGTDESIFKALNDTSCELSKWNGKDICVFTKLAAERVAAACKKEQKIPMYCVQTGIKTAAKPGLKPGGVCLEEAITGNCEGVCNYKVTKGVPDPSSASDGFKCIEDPSPSIGVNQLIENILKDGVKIQQASCSEVKNTSGN